MPTRLETQSLVRWRPKPSAASGFAHVVFDHSDQDCKLESALCRPTVVKESRHAFLGASKHLVLEAEMLALCTMILFRSVATSGGEGEGRRDELLSLGEL